MSAERLVEFLAGIHPLSEEFKIALLESVTPISLPKNYLLLEAPRVAEYAYFLNNGYAMSYTFQKGRRQVENFWSAGQVVMSPKSFFDQVPSREFIQLLEPSDLICITQSNAQKLVERFQEAQIIQRSVILHALEMERERIRDLYQLDTTIRHEKILRLYPGLEQAASQEWIASYLGVTPQTLSRIKRESKS